MIIMDNFYLDKNKYFFINFLINFLYILKKEILQ